MAVSLSSLAKDKPHVMGVLNLTPDSFSDGGTYFKHGKLDALACVDRVMEMCDEGASIIDLGAESTRPGAHPISSKEQLQRLLPVLKHLDSVPAVISVDTSSADVMKHLQGSPVGLLNDVRALQEPKTLQAAALLGIPVCLMHMQQTPLTMQIDPRYNDTVADISQWLKARMEIAIQAGISRERLLIDPGFGFGKTADHNQQLLRQLRQFTCLAPTIGFAADLIRLTEDGALKRDPCFVANGKSSGIASVANENSPRL